MVEEVPGPVQDPLSDGWVRRIGNSDPSLYPPLLVFSGAAPNLAGQPESVAPRR